LGSITGPLTLLAFLALVVLAIFRRAVDDKRGLEYVYHLFSSQLTKDQFYNVTTQIINRVFWLIIFFFFVAMLAFGLTNSDVLKLLGRAINPPAPVREGSLALVSLVPKEHGPGFSLVDVTVQNTGSADVYLSSAAFVVLERKVPHGCLM